MFWFAACSTDSNETNGNEQSEQETISDVPDDTGSDEETPPVEEKKSIPYDLTVFALYEEQAYELTLENGDLMGDGTLLDIFESIPYVSKFKVEGTKLFLWNKDLVWTYDVESQEKMTYSDYFDAGDGTTRFNLCTVPSDTEIFTFYSTNEDSTLDFYFAESFNMETGETYQINLPNSALAPLTCIFQYKTGTKEMLLYNHYDEYDNLHMWGVIDLDKKEYTSSVNLGLRPFAINNDEIVFVSSITSEFYNYNINTATLSSPKNFYYTSEYLAGISSRVLLDFKSETRFPARFESNKMIFYNGATGEVSSSGNVSEFFGPAILDMDTGAFDVFSSLKIYQTYFAISEGRWNLEILQSEIDLESETIMVTYRDATHDSSPFGIMILDFELNLLKHFDFGQLQPIALIKH